MSEETYFKSRKHIKKYLIDRYGFKADAIDVVGVGRWSTYLFIAENNRLFKHNLGGQPTYMSNTSLDITMDRILKGQQTF